MMPATARKHLWPQAETKVSNRYFLKICLTREQKDLVWKLYGPDRMVSPKIKAIILDPYSRRNPDQWNAFVGAANAIESKMEHILQKLQKNDPVSWCDFILACQQARQLLDEVNRHEP